MNIVYGTILSRVRTVSRTRPPDSSRRSGVAEVRMVIPSSRKMAATASETSSSSIVISRGPVWTTVTWLPNRRNICPNSSPT
jgi:hypothetical protein